MEKSLLIIELSDKVVDIGSGSYAFRVLHNWSIRDLDAVLAIYEKVKGELDGTQTQAARSV